MRSANLMQFILQVQAPSSVQAAPQSAGAVSFSQATERAKVCKKDTWPFGGDVHHPEVLCDAH